MEMKYSQTVLRNRFIFRLGVFILSLLFFIIYWKTKGTATIYNILLGVSGSLCAWALVELIDFIIETCQKYWHQRNQFFLMLNDYWHEMNILLKSEPDDISYEGIKDVIERMYNEVAQYPFKAEVYTISKEWEQYVNYIIRLHEAFWGNFFHGAGYKYSMNENKKYLYSILVKEEKILPNCLTYKNDIDEIVRQAEIFSRIEISFEKLEESKAIRYTSRGLIKETFDIMKSEVTLYSLKPQLDFEEIYLRNNKEPGFLSIMKLLFREIQF